MRSGDREFDRTFTLLFNEQFPLLYRYVNRLVGEPDLAADVAQEAFVKLYQRGVVPDDARAWLAAVATNLVRDERRTAVRRGNILAENEPEATHAPPVDVEVLAAEQRGAVRRALEALPERDREMLLLRHAGYSYREVAQSLGLAESSVGTMLARATAAFHATFTERMRAST